MSYSVVMALYCFPPVLFLGLFLAAPQQAPTPYPPINRDTEYFEKSYKRDDEKLMEERKKVLTDAQNAAQEIVSSSRSMKVVFGSYSDGKLDKKKFQKWFRSLADKIDDSTGPIVRINMIDPSFQDDPETYQEVSSKDAFVILIDEMEKVSQQLQRRVLNLTGGTGTSVEDLQAPSLTALTENVKRLSKVLEKSVKKM